MLRAPAWRFLLSLLSSESIEEDALLLGGAGAGWIIEGIIIIGVAGVERFFFFCGMADGCLLRWCHEAGARGGAVHLALENLIKQ